MPYSKSSMTCTSWSGKNVLYPSTHVQHRGWFFHFSLHFSLSHAALVIADCEVWKYWLISNVSMREMKLFERSSFVPPLSSLVCSDQKCCEMWAQRFWSLGNCRKKDARSDGSQTPSQWNSQMDFLRITMATKFICPHKLFDATESILEKVMSIGSGQVKHGCSVHRLLIWLTLAWFLKPITQWHYSCMWQILCPLISSVRRSS